MLKGKQNRSSKTSIPQFAEGNIEDYIQILYNHQKQCEKSAKYMQAEMAKKKLQQMKIQLEKNRKILMFNKHEEEKRQVQISHIQQISEFNKFWDEKMIQYQKYAENLQDEALQKHQQEIDQYSSQLENSIGMKPKPSSQIINLRKVQQNLVKQQKYLQAHQIQKHLQGLQKSQHEKWIFTRSNKIKNILNQLKNKQQTEIRSLRQRIQQGFEEQKKVRTQQEQKILQKYLNFIKELQNQQLQEKLKFDKSVKLKSNLNFSRQSNISRIQKPS